MEDVSCAFHPVATRAGAGHPVPTIHLDRLAFVLGRYLAQVGSPWPEERLREAIERFIAECPRVTSDEEDADDGGAPDAE